MANAAKRREERVRHGVCVGFAVKFRRKVRG